MAIAEYQTRLLCVRSTVVVRFNMNIPFGRVYMTIYGLILLETLLSIPIPESELHGYLMIK
jgi:hypothetical protein